MEKKTTQRIIGVLVIAALVIILLPLMFGRNDSNSIMASKSPPFPAENLASDSVKPSDAVPSNSVALNQNAASLASSNIENTTPSTEVPKTLDNQTKIADLTNMSGHDQSTSITTATTLTANETKSITDTHDLTKVNQAAGNTNAVDKNINHADKNAGTADKALLSSGEKLIKKADKVLLGNGEKPLKTAEKTAVVKTAVNEKNSANTKSENKKLEKLAKNAHAAQLKNAAWVVQMGSFKNKNNARNLADKLRAAGFKAFTNEVKSTHGDRVRVYVGPEFKQASAEKVSTQVMQQFKLQGIVVPYKPLEL